MMKRTKREKKLKRIKKAITENFKLFCKCMCDIHLYYINYTIM